MGERQSGGGPPGRAAGRGARPALLDAEVEALIVASLVRDGVDAEAEQRAVAAFRAARDAGDHRTRARRRGDGEPRERRSPGRSLRTALSVLFGGLVLVGVVMGVIGAAGFPADDGPPAPAPATEDDCRDYRTVGGNGRVMNAMVWQRLVAAAGGARNVTAYCTAQLAEPKPDGNDGRATP
ncbi:MULTISPECIES: hypothetical protein [Streptomyces]|uniref:Uncharacterized protein n=1 Tax=Streptomyces koelreuteriae TaxID=2838015 RepID=A0ABX8FQN0_9ACTN|nr:MULTISPECIES: hypothetical protein [Streptomyces]QWB23479.1 hypothetical protein KJK29_13165 [Streptomyces koelreuteriae]UUA06435.1 hypothetical protein NNW98_13225 [Streptomyces koelreuteriae]UUA14064.1 hypothetical protein NNW99_13225 [Streptomyces sp. CRCS-T-1]